MVPGHTPMGSWAEPEEVESLDDYFNNQRTIYDELSPETVDPHFPFRIKVCCGK